MLILLKNKRIFLKTILLKNLMNVGIVQQKAIFWTIKAFTKLKANLSIYSALVLNVLISFNG